MDKRDHNGPAFMYKVLWRRAGGTNVHWNSTDVQSPPLLIGDAGTYTPFEIKVQAVNSLGAGPVPEPEIGHSGEDSTSKRCEYSDLEKAVMKRVSVFKHAVLIGPNSFLHTKQCGCDQNPLVWP